MAKKDGKKKTDRGDMSWMDRFATPSRAEFQKYLRGQEQQFSPVIGTLQDQIGLLMRPGQDPTVRAYEELLGGVASDEATRAAYQAGLGNVAGFLQNIDASRAGRGVSEAVSALGGALGVGGAAGDVAQAAGTVSGVGEALGDIGTKALMQSAAGQFANLEAQRLSELSGQRQQLRLGAAEARKGVQQQRMDLARMLAEARGQRIAAAPNPLDVANAFMQYQQNRRTLAGYGRGGSGTSAATAAASAGDTPVGATESEILAWMQSPTGGGYGVIGQGGLGSEGAARGQFRQQNRRNR